MLITTELLRQQGFTTAGIRTMTTTGWLRRVRRGIYERVNPSQGPRTPEDEHRTLIEAVLTRYPNAVLSHVSAAVLQGLPVPQASLGRVHVTRPAKYAGGKRMGGVYLHRVTEDVPTSELDGIRVTTMDRTVLDLARALQPTDGLAVTDRALALGADQDTLMDLLDDQPRRRGNELARRIIAFADSRAESPGESWARWVMAQAGLPAPELQVEFFDLRTGRLVARTDFAWSEHRLVGEFDGEVKYGRLLKPGQGIQDVIMAEKRREQELRRLGQWIVRFTTAEVFQRGLLGDLVREGIGYARG